MQQAISPSSTENEAPHSARVHVAIGAALLGALLGGGCGSGERVANVRWVAAQAIDGGRVVHLVMANSSGIRPREVKVRIGDTEVGLTLRVRIPQTYVQDLRLRCVEIGLSEPVGRRRIVDEASGPFNPFGVSVLVAHRALKDRLGAGCVRVPAPAA